jgi:hypothetical protein
LRTEHDEAPVEQERGNRVNTDRVCLTGRNLDLVRVAIAGDRRLCIVEAQLCSKVRRTAEPPMFRSSSQYACMSRSCVTPCLPCERASSVRRRAACEFGTTSAGGL